MNSCECYIVKQNKRDFLEYDDSFEGISALLYENNINVEYRTDISPDAGKINSTLRQSLSLSGAPDYYIFFNALYTQDASSFRNLFYEFIAQQESDLKKKSPDVLPKIKVMSLGDMGNGYKGYCLRIRDKKFIVLPCPSLTGITPAEQLVSALISADRLFEQQRALYPDGIDYRPITDGQKNRPHRGTKPHAKEGFFKSFIPQKNDPPRTKARKWAVLAAILAFLIALGYVINYFFIAPLHNTQVNAEIQEIAYQNTAETNEDGEPVSEQDWAALKKLNKEIVGWIRIDDTRIDYPVFEHIGDDASSQYYLKHNYKGDYSDYGSIFVDYRCKQSVNSKNVILHGHHMNDGSMFENLMGYGKLEGDLSYYKKHPVITFNTPEGDAKWKIISVFKTSTLYAHGEFFNYMQGEFNSDAEFMNFVYNVRIRSLINTPVVINETDQLLTLSTCSYEFSDFRTVVVARKVRNGESADVDVQLATKNDKPVFPDVYYSRYGGTRPTVLTFKSADSKGLITWYDGEGDLKGDETLTATVAANPTEPPSEKSKTSSRATQSAEITFYTVMFMNFDGSEYQSFSVQEGSPSPYPETNPATFEDEYFYYYFRGWDTANMNMDNVTTSMNIAPIYEPVAK